MPESVFFDQCEVLAREDGSLWELGSGVTGTTYRGFDTRLRVPVALKIIHAACLAGEGTRERFREAALKASRLHHRHIAAVFHSGEEGGKCFYTMEFVDGESLALVVEQEAALPVSLAMEIVAQAASALHAAQAQGIVHGDIKPSNLMLIRDDEGDTELKVLDFGLSRRSFSGGAASAAGAVEAVGVIRQEEYVSPEQREGRPVDGRSDIYSLGVVFWEMLAGETPFHGLAGETRSEPGFGSLPWDKLKDQPQAVVDLLRKMLETDPARRPQTPDEVLQGIMRCRDPLGAPSDEFPTVAEARPREEAIAEKKQPAAPAAETPPVLPERPRMDDFPTVAEAQSWEEVLAERKRIEDAEREGLSGADKPLEVDSASTVDDKTMPDSPQPEAEPKWEMVPEPIESEAEPVAPGGELAPELGTEWQTSRAGRPALRGLGIGAFLVAVAAICYLFIQFDLQHDLRGLWVRMASAFKPSPTSRPTPVPTPPENAYARQVSEAQKLGQDQQWRQAFEAWLAINRQAPSDQTSKEGLQTSLSHLFAPPRSFSQEEFNSMRANIEDAAQRGVVAAKELLQAEKMQKTAEEAEKETQWADAAKAHLSLRNDYAKYGFGQAGTAKFLARLKDHLGDISPAQFETMLGEIQKQARAGGAAADEMRSALLAHWAEAVRKLEGERKWREALASSLRLAKADPEGIPQLKALLNFLNGYHPTLTPKETAQLQKEIAKEFDPMREDLTDAAQLFDISYAQCLLGDRLRKTEPKISFAWYCAAARNGEPVAMVVAAQMLLDGTGTTQDKASALEYMKMAEKDENISARTLASLAMCYQASGVDGDLQHAVELLKRASDGRDGGATSKLGDWSHKGIGGEKDDNAAFQYFQKAEQMDDAIATLNLGLLYKPQDSELVFKNGEKRAFKRDPRLADKKLTKAFEQFKEITDKEIGSADFMYFRALCHEKGYPPSAQNDGEARNWYEKAAAAGDARAVQWCENHPKPR